MLLSRKFVEVLKPNAYIAFPFLWFQGIQAYVDNRHVYGYMPIPLRSHQTLVEDIETFVHLAMEVMSELLCCQLWSV